MQRKTLLAALIAILNGTAYQAHAYSVTVVASRPVEQQVVCSGQVILATVLQ